MYCQKSHKLYKYNNLTRRYINDICLTSCHLPPGGPEYQQQLWINPRVLSAKKEGVGEEGGGHGNDEGERRAWHVVALHWIMFWGTVCVRVNGCVLVWFDPRPVVGTHGPLDIGQSGRDGIGSDFQVVVVFPTLASQSAVIINPD